MTQEYQDDQIPMLHGERILWRGNQWYVSTHGLGAIRNDTYWHEKHRLGWKPGGAMNYANHAVPFTDTLTGITQHNASDPFFDLEDLIEANRQAIRLLRLRYPKAAFELEADYCRRFRAFRVARKALRVELPRAGVLPNSGIRSAAEWLAEGEVLDAELARRGCPQHPNHAIGARTRKPYAALEGN